MNFHGSGKRITDYDIPRIGATIGVGEDEIHALLDVEASGSGYDRQGRLKMLFEPKKFYEQLTPKGGDPRAPIMLAKRERAVREGLASPNRPTHYPPDSYPRLYAAMLIDEVAALKACSWGLGQIMGFNHVAAGYPNVYDMIAAFRADEANQLQAIVNFLKYNKLDDELRNHDWRGVARGYNGADYERDGYHLKLANAYIKWARIKDTPWHPGMAPPKAPELPTAPKILVPGPGKPGAIKELAPTFWGRVVDLFRPSKGDDRDH